MKPRRTVHSNKVFRLVGGTEDNDLWVSRYEYPDGAVSHGSVWVPTDDERRQIAAGANIELVIAGTGHPPVSMGLNTDELKGVSRECGTS